MVQRRIGLDFAGVIMDALKNLNTSTSFNGSNYMRATAVEGAFPAVKKLVAQYGQEQLFIISKCRKITEHKITEWLRGNGFFKQTGFNPENVFFCRKNDDKAPIAAFLQLTDFVDDHTCVLDCMDTVRLRYLFGPRPKNVGQPRGLIVVRTWAEAEVAIAKAQL